MQRGRESLKEHGTREWKTCLHWQEYKALAVYLLIIALSILNIHVSVAACEQSSLRLYVTISIQINTHH